MWRWGRKGDLPCFQTGRERKYEIWSQAFGKGRKLGDSRLCDFNNSEFFFLLHLYADLSQFCYSAMVRGSLTVDFQVGATCKYSHLPFVSHLLASTLQERLILRWMQWQSIGGLAKLLVRSGNEVPSVQLVQRGRGEVSWGQGTEGRVEGAEKKATHNSRYETPISSVSCNGSGFYEIFHGYLFHQ